MKKFALFGMLLFLMTSTVPSYGFLDYFFSGSASRDAIDNSAVGDLRAWWTGNPGYQFNPYWSGPQAPNQQQGQQTNPMNPASTQGYSPMGSPSPGTSQAPPTVNYYPQQAPGQPGQGMYGGAPQQYQQVPQQYQATPQQYQQVPQQYRPAPQQYPAPSAYQGAPQGYQGVAQQQAPLPQAYPAGTQQYQGSPQQAYPAGAQQYQGGR